MYKMLINIGLGHLGWEILPGPMGPGPWALAAGAWAPGPGTQGPAAAWAHGPRPMGPGKISQARSPSQGVPGLQQLIFIYCFLYCFLY